MLMKEIRYTKNLVSSFSSSGVPIDYIQVGNEINDGLLWPTGRISVSGAHAASELLHSAVSGVRVASSSTKTIIHIANGWDQGSVQWFYNNIFVPGALAPADVDIMGFSFYPFYGTGATLNALQSSMQNIISQYNKVTLRVSLD
jgi:arabinogalactan endo-1,4-beta-galactosidase